MDPQWLLQEEHDLLKEVGNTLVREIPAKQPSLKTFRRQRFQPSEDAQSSQNADTRSSGSEPRSTVLDAEDRVPNAKESFQDQNKSEAVPKQKRRPKNEQSAGVVRQNQGLYTRKVPASEREKADARRRAYMADMRAHFEEVDAFELLTISPDIRSSKLGLRTVTQAESSSPPRCSLSNAAHPEILLREVSHAQQSSSYLENTSHADMSEAQQLQTTEADLGLNEDTVFSAEQNLSTEQQSADVAHRETAQQSEASDRVSDHSQENVQFTRRSTYGLSKRISIAIPEHDSTQVWNSRLSLSQGARRQSLVFRPSIDRRGSQVSASLFSRHSLAPRRQSLAPRRPSFAAQRPSMAARFSLGLPAALQTLSHAGALAPPDNRSSLAQERSIGGQATPSISSSLPDRPKRASLWQQTDISPIAESTGTASPGTETKSVSPRTDVRDPLSGPSQEQSLPDSSANLSDHTTQAADVSPVSETISGKTQLLASADTAAEIEQNETVEHHKPLESLEATEEDELADDVSNICGAINELTVAEEAEESLTPLQRLLRMCNQSIDESKLPSMDELICQHVDVEKIKKIGEGTFGEAFKGGNVVLKIVPMDGTTLVNGEVQKRADEIYAEASVALTLNQLRSGGSNMTPGFVETYGVGICRGVYAPLLVKEWQRWDEQNQSENDPVDCFPESQLYVVFVVADGGTDLEHFEMRNFAEAKSMLLQCAMTLAVAEEACEFEHRDLHWGNILLKRQAPETIKLTLRDVKIGVQSAGLTMTLIDFTLSRLVTVSEDIAFCDLSADPALFDGPKGDCQAETYRRMKKATSGDWQAHSPVTNALWMHYLADLLLTQKQMPATADEKRQLRNFRRRALNCKSCADLISDEVFKGCWRTM